MVVLSCTQKSLLSSVPLGGAALDTSAGTFTVTLPLAATLKATNCKVWPAAHVV